MATTRRSLFLYVAFEADAAGVSDQRILTVLAAMNLISGISPLLTPLFLVLLNHVQLIWLTIFLTSSAQLSMGLSTSFSVFVPAASAIGFGRGVFDPVVSSLYASALPAEERAKVSSVVELAWGLSSFIGVPLYGLMMGVDGSAPHFMLAILLMFSALPFTRLKVEKQQTSEESSTGGMLDKVHTCCGRYSQLRHRKDVKRVLTMTLALFATQFGGELLAVCFGLWLVRVQGLPVEFVATATLAIGVADLLAEALVIVCISWKGYDVFGFTRIAVAANILGFALLPFWCSLGTLPGIIGFTAPLLAFECCCIGLIGCIVQTAGPQSGGAVESICEVGTAAGKVSADLLAIPLFGLLSGGVLFPTAASLLVLVVSGAHAACHLYKDAPEDSSAVETELELSSGSWQSVPVDESRPVGIGEEHATI